MTLWDAAGPMRRRHQPHGADVAPVRGERVVVAFVAVAYVLEKRGDGG